MSLIKNHLLSSQKTQANHVLDPNRSLKPFLSFDDILPHDWDALLKATAHLRDLNQRLLLTRLTAFRKKNHKASLNKLDALD